MQSSLDSGAKIDDRRHAHMAERVSVGKSGERAGRGHVDGYTNLSCKVMLSITRLQTGMVASIVVWSTW